ncbi:MAG: methyl-accepting chemotaxis protein, partial [Jannaschia sp.]
MPKVWFGGGLSIKAQLIGVLLLLGTLLAGLSVASVWQAQRTLALAGRAADAVPDRIALGRIADKVGRELLHVYGHLLGESDLDTEARIELAAIFAEHDGLADRLLKDLSDDALRLRLTADLVSHRARRVEALDQAEKSFYMRDMAVARDWLSETERLLVDFRTSGGRMISPDEMTDASMAALLFALEESDWLIHYVTLESAVMGAHVVARTHMSTEPAARLAADRTRIEHATMLLAARGEGTEDPALSTYLQTLNGPVATSHREMVREILASDPRAEDPILIVDPEAWLDSVDRYRATLHDLGDYLVAHLGERVALAERLARMKFWGFLALSVFVLAVIAACSLMIIRRISRPLSEAVATLSSLAEGELYVDTDRLPKQNELGRLREAIEHLAGELRAAEALKHAEELRRAAAHADRESAAKAERSRLEREQAADRLLREKAEEARLREEAVARDVSSVVHACARGDFSQTIELSGRDGIFLDLCKGVNAIGEAARRGLNDIEEALKALSQGNLSSRPRESHEGVFERILDGIDRTAASLGGTIATASRSGSRILTASGDISEAAEGLAVRTESSARNLRDISSTVARIAEMVGETADAADRARTVAAQSDRNAGEGVAAADRTVEAMAEIERLSQAIEGKVAVIEDIAMQTNLLALNASVEAAHAGPSGRGFAVVASEIRHLAKKSAAAADTIGDLIARSVVSVGRGAALVRQTETTFRDIAASSAAISTEVADVATS